MVSTRTSLFSTTPRTRSISRYFIEASADFADLFEVKDALSKKGEHYHRIEANRLVLGYRREGFVRETWIAPGSAASIDEHGLRFNVHLEPHGQWTTGLDVILAPFGFGERRSNRDMKGESGCLAGGGAQALV